VAALPVRRSRIVETPDGRGALVIEVDATGDPEALAVLQASLHEVPDGCRVVYGYDLVVIGLGAWVGDRRIRLRVWPALLDDAGEVTADDPDAPGADLLEIDLDPSVDADALEALAATNRVLIAGPETGPTPVLVDLDPDLVAETLESLTS
jgi:hypothetical protein